MDNFHEATEMVGREFVFALNPQMTPLRCVIVGYDGSRGRPLFTISLNTDPGITEFQPEKSETYLRDVDYRYLFRPELGEPVFDNNADAVPSK